MKKEKMYSYGEQILQWQIEGNVLELFEAGKIAQFKKDHGATLERIQKDIKEVQGLFMVFDKNGLISRDTMGQAVFHPNRTLAELNQFFQGMMDQDHTANAYELIKSAKQYIADNPDGLPAKPQTDEAPKQESPLTVAKGTEVSETATSEITGDQGEVKEDTSAIKE